MAQRISVWSVEEAAKELQKRIDAGQRAREMFESMWDTAERAAYNTRGKSLTRSFGLPILDNVDFGLPDVDGSNSEIGVNYAFKNVRFLHAQLSANPPSIAVRPLTPDAEDRRKAEAAELLKQYFMRQYNLQEVVDQISLNTLIYGTGFAKVYWDSDKGDIIDVDEQTGMVTTEGDFAVESIKPRDIFIDPDATKLDEIRFIIQRMFIPWDEAVFMWPDKKDMLETCRLKEGNEDKYQSALSQSRWDVVELYEYWEKGLPMNGMLGRYTICTAKGELIEPVRANPHRFLPPKKTGKLDDGETEPRRFEAAQLPFIIFTDVDVPNRVWGASALSFAVALQDSLNNLDSAALDNVYAHSVTRMVLPDGAEIKEGSITNSPWDIIKITGQQAPEFMPPQPLQTAAVQLRQLFMQGIDTVFGVNESMFGQQSRETSGFSMQYATNQGNMVRRRLFNKYTMLVEGIYRNLFNLFRKHKTLKQTIHVLGEENVMQSYSFSGADVDGGFDFVGEYGTNLSLDPITRRQEILSLYPILKEAGEDPKRVMSMLKLNDFSEPSIADLGKARQREIVYRIINKEMTVDPKPWEHHDSMVAWLMYFFQTAEWRDLHSEAQGRIWAHYQARLQMMATTKAQAAGGGQAGPGAPISTPQETAMTPDAGLAAGAPAPMPIANQ